MNPDETAQIIVEGLVCPEITGGVMPNQTQPLTLEELKQQGNAAFSATQQAIEHSQEIWNAAMAGEEQMRVAWAEFEEMMRLGVPSSVLDLPQVKRWEETRQAREATYLLRLGEMCSQRELEE